VNNEFPSVGDILALLRSIQDVVRTTAKREETLNQGRRLNQSRRKGDAEEAVIESNRRLEAELAQAESERELASGALAERHRRRRAWIERAHRASRSTVDEKIRAAEGQGQYDRQKNLILIDRQRDEETANARTLYDELRVSLGESQRRQSDVEKRARKAVRGYGQFAHRLQRALSITADPAGGSDVDGLLDSTKKDLDRAEDALEELEELPLPALFRILPFSIGVILILGVHAAAYFLLPADLGGQQLTPTAGSAIGFVILAIILHLAGGVQARPLVTTIRSSLGDARAAVTAAAREIEREEEGEFARIEAQHQRGMADLKEKFKRRLGEAEQIRTTAPEKVEARFRRAVERHDRLGISKAAGLVRKHQAHLAQIRQAAAARETEIAASLSSLLGSLEGRYQQDWDTLVQNWESTLPGGFDEIEEVSAAVASLFPAWTEAAVSRWAPPATFVNAAPIGALHGVVAALAGAIPQTPRLSLPRQEFEIPLLLRIPDQASLIIETRGAGRTAAIATLNDSVYRLLASVPPGRVSFTFIDPVGLGESFSGMMRLADYEESLITSKIWTQPDQIERRLVELNEHMEKVIQMYLRNEFRTITEYNDQAGNIAEKYRFLVVADFPHGFSTTAAQRLVSIATAGPRCGVYLLLHWDRRESNTFGLKEDDLRANAISLVPAGDGFALLNQPDGVTVHLEVPPAPELAGSFLDRVGKASIDSTRVEVPFAHIAPDSAAIWSENTTNELRVPIGRTGATKLQYLALGKGTRQHALIAGKTGSGKSTLFHVIITNLALWAEPDQVEFYLIDFKKGVEFKCYATSRLPHARVIAIESDREFGLSVLQRIDEELRRRGELFRQLGAQDIAGYFRAGGQEAMPRSLLLIDEFQEFFTEDDRVAQNAALLLDRIVRQGRAFGIHVILGSQTLGGAFTLARATLGQMAVRIALQCNEADSYLILDENNAAARMLSRPGEGIYNDNAGASEGNSPFQVVWLPDAVRETHLTAIRQRAEATGFNRPGPLVFEGNTPADVRENDLLTRLLAQPGGVPGGGIQMFLGAPNSIKGPALVTFKRQSGNHLLLAGQQDETVLALTSIALVTLAAQHRELRLIVLDGSAPETAERELLTRAIAAVPGEVKRIGNAEIEATFAGLAAEVRERASQEDGGGRPPVFVFILGLQRFKKLRHEDDFSFGSGESKPKPDEDLATLIQEGPAAGVHLVIHCDTYNNVNRFLSRKALGEFEMRVVFQMSANDSASLIDSPKAGSLGINRALLYNEQEGTLETFRPYALPDAAWFAAAARKA